MQKDKNLHCCLASRSMRPNGKYKFSQKSTTRVAPPARFQYAAQEDNEGYGKGDIKIDRGQKGQRSGGNAPRALQGYRQSREARRRQGEHRSADEITRFQACRCTFEIAVIFLSPRQESNLDQQLRKLLFYPLNYGRERFESIPCSVNPIASNSCRIAFPG